MDWDDVPEDAEHVTTAARDPGLLECPENGYCALVAWCAGPSHTARRPAHGEDDERRVTVVVNDAVGERHFSRPFTVEDRQAVDDDIDDYLRDAGVPPRPRGYRWFIRADPGFWRQLDHQLGHHVPPSPHPSEIRRALEELVPTLFHGA